MKTTIKKIVIHCSDTPDDRDVCAADIHRWHLERGWSGIGYHFVIKRNGEVEAGRPLYWPGAHTLGHNEDSIAGCLIGRSEFDDEQYKSLKSCADILLAEYKGSELYGHYELDSKKTCPNFDVKAWYKKALAEAAQ